VAGVADDGKLLIELKLDAGELARSSTGVKRVDTEREHDGNLSARLWTCAAGRQGSR
jgi:hypothetical protein